METTKTFESFPMWTVFRSNLVSVLIYLSGIIITLSLSWIAGVLFLVYILALEYRLLSRHCINCFYWGKRCGSGKGRLSSLLFKKGDPLKFCSSNLEWKDMIPDLLVSLIPFVLAIVLMVLRFNLILLFSAVVLLAMSTFGNSFIRGNLTCKHCKQREIGCPAYKLFTKK